MAYFKALIELVAITQAASSVTCFSLTMILLLWYYYFLFILQRTYFAYYSYSSHQHSLLLHFTGVAKFCKCFLLDYAIYVVVCSAYILQSLSLFQELCLLVQSFVFHFFSLLSVCATINAIVMLLISITLILHLIMLLFRSLSQYQLEMYLVGAYFKPFLLLS